MYRLATLPRAEKHFAKLPQKTQQKIFIALSKLANNPFNRELNIKKMVASKQSYRLRVGELRVIYEMDTKSKAIFILDIDFRRTTTY
ncbi:type II toxin-antitoxin system RelE/ParE family toxin [Candidatus Daviesbacteria bacterium]|nr:type II toxin-antitoxin system RelE/ParE family toxin [Candidatus Daviesbacteria bacterium]